MKFHSIPELIEDIKAGKMVVLFDDLREQEGDLIMAAEFVTPEAVNFMITEARGLLCMPMNKVKCDALNLPLMVNQASHTNFTVSIDAASGVQSGTSVHDRAHTIRLAADSHAKPSDFVKPGHVFPIMAQEGGLKVRQGHTEASITLMEAAGLKPVAVLIEILNQSGSMANAEDLLQFADFYGLKIGNMDDLIEFFN